MNKVTQASVEISFKAASGYESVETFGPTAGPAALENGLREIVRIMAINGDADKIVAIMGETFDAVAADREEQSSVSSSAEGSDPLLRAIMDRDAWRTAMVGLCQIWPASPEHARAHLKARLIRKAGSVEKAPASNDEQPAHEYRRGLLDAAKVCEAIHEKHWAAYKSSPPDDLSRGNPYVDGMASGASECESAIQELANPESKSASAVQSSREQ